MNPRKEIKKVYDYVLEKVNNANLRDVSKIHKAVLNEKVFDIPGMCYLDRPNFCSYSICVKSICNARINDIGVHVSIKEHWNNQHHAIATIKLLINEPRVRHDFLLNQIIRGYMNLAVERNLIGEIEC